MPKSIQLSTQNKIYKTNIYNSGSLIKFKGISIRNENTAK